MPLDPTQREAIRTNLQRIANGEKPPLIIIGELTQKQFADINAYRSAEQLPALESAVVVYSGRHHYGSRIKDGYTIEDMLLQIESALSAHSEVVAGKKMTGVQNKQGRNDGYGHIVKDLVVLELTSRKPRAEALSVIPKGDGK